jgi:hypothetical protein
MFISGLINHSLILFLQQALVGEGSGEEQLFSSEGSSIRDGIGCELDNYLQKLKVMMQFLSLSPTTLQSPFATLVNVYLLMAGKS